MPEAAKGVTGAGPRAHVAGVPIHAATLDEAVRLIAAAVEAQRPTRVFTLNLDHLVKLRGDEAFRAVYRRADLVTADGWPVAHLARRDDRLIQRVAGADLIHPVCALAAQRGWPVALYGSTDEVLRLAAERLGTMHAGLAIAHREAPPMGFDVVKAAPMAAEAASRAGARIMLVALGAPKQEFFSDAGARAGVPLVYLCIGAGLDFIAGKVTRAPRLVQKLGMEWFFRLIQEPRRLFVRYLRSGIVFLSLLAAKKSRAPANE